MRAIVLAAFAFLTLSGCDSSTPVTKTVTTGCNCTMPAPMPIVQPAVPARRAIRHYSYHSDHYARSHGYRWRNEYAQAPVFTYDYHSDSHSSYTGGEHSYSGGHGDGWTEVHARGYRYSAGGASDGWTQVQSGGAAYSGTPDDTRSRRHAWTGYDARCRDSRD